MGNTERKPFNKKKKITLIVVAVLFTLIVTALIAGIIFYNNILNKINRYDNDSATIGTGIFVDEDGYTVPSPSGPTVDPYDFDTMFPGEEPIGGEIINIMLVGQDTRDPEYRGLSDTMILISINPKSGKLVMTSFIRDLYIDIVGIGGSGLYKDRLNTAYCTGGIDQLADTLAYNFGVEIDNFVEVDFQAFRTIVDALGGVDIELTEAEQKHMHYELGFDVTVGLNHFNGEQTLAYARIRAIDNDFNRTARQRTVINEILKKVKNAGVKDLLLLVEEFLPLVTTDMSNIDITKYIVQVAPMLKDLEIESLQIPVDNTWGGKNVGTEEVPKYVIACHDTKSNRDALNKALGVITEDN